MSKPLIGIVDYGSGNFTSVHTCITQLGYRSRLIYHPNDIEGIDLLLLPGVGAFASAMHALNELELTDAIREYAKAGNPVLGICLGMQLLAETSYELGITRGLKLIPGEVKALAEPKWHIGWNALESRSIHPLAKCSNGMSLYFNHSYAFHAPAEYILSIARTAHPIVAIVKKENICGVQFHPEKSQTEGKHLLRAIIQDLLGHA